MRELRRSIAFMVINGFSLLELRKLYIDEFNFFYEEMLFGLESIGKIDKGTYDKLNTKSVEEITEDTVSSLRKQMKKLFANKRK